MYRVDMGTTQFQRPAESLQVSKINSYRRSSYKTVQPTQLSRGEMMSMPQADLSWSWAKPRPRFLVSNMKYIKKNSILTTFIMLCIGKSRKVYRKFLEPITNSLEILHFKADKTSMNEWMNGGRLKLIGKESCIASNLYCRSESLAWEWMVIEN